MNDDRTAILSRLAGGEISVDDAAGLLRNPAPASPPAAASSSSGRWMRIRVTDLETGKSRVNVNLPLSWVEVGLKIGARYQPEIEGIDLGDILAQLQAGANGKIVEVEDVEDNQRVEIFVD